MYILGNDEATLIEATARLLPQPPQGWLLMQDAGLSAPMRQPVPVTDMSGIPRYRVTHTRSWPADRFEVAAVDSRPVASIRQRHYGSPWYRASMPSKQSIEMRKDLFDADCWLRLRGMGLTLTPLERYRPSAVLSTSDGTPVIGFGYRRLDGERGSIATTYAAAVCVPAWDDVAVTVLALLRYEYLDYFDIVRGSGAP